MEKSIKKTTIFFWISIISLMINCTCNAGFFQSGIVDKSTIDQLVLGFYCDYDFQNNKVAIYWKDENHDQHSGYIIKVYALVEGDDTSDGCARYLLETPAIINQNVQPASDNNNLTLDLSEGRYQIEIFGNNISNTSSTIIFKNTYWFVKMPPQNIQYTWCYDPSQDNESADTVRTRLFYNNSLSDTYSYYIDMNSDKLSYMDKYQYGDKLYLSILNYKILDDCQKVNASPLGIQTIIYVVLPPSINKDTIHLQQCD